MPEPGRFDAWVRSVGTDPDPRFTLANERTFLSWITLCLGMLGVGLAVGTLIPGDPVALKVLALLWILMAALLSYRALRRWLRVERALRRAEPLPLSRSVPAVAIGLAVLGILTGIVMVAAS